MKLTIIGIFLIIIAIILALHQFSMGYPFFQIEDLHHETFMVAFGLVGFVLIFIGRGR